jgi:hypothetical protein
MTAVLTPPSPGDTRSALADWMELQALSSSRGRATMATLSNVLDIADDDAAQTTVMDEETGELLDDSILEEDRSATVNATFEELEYRQKVIGSAYPFSVNTDGPRLALDRIADNLIICPGQVVYLFCLLASAIREKKIQPAASLTAAEKELADTFQICACLAAGGYVSGDVSSFGFPRASSDAFLPALRAAFERFGIGQVRADIPDGFPDSLKDGGIDVIAWRNHPDDMPGKIYMLGQCASGMNWKSKTVVEYIHQLHGSWFTDGPPATHTLPAMFIPFTFHRDLNEERRGSYLDAMRNLYRYEERRFGIIFDRLRIAHFANSCMTSDHDARRRVDGTERFASVQRWVETALRLAGIRTTAA